jgi:hypothetical protein
MSGSTETPENGAISAVPDVPVAPVVADAPVVAAPEPVAVPEPVAAPATVAETESLLESAGKVEEPKPADPATPTDPAKPAEAPPVVEAPKPEPIAYQDFTLPEGVKVAPEALTEAKVLFAAANIPQGQAQSLVDLHAKYASDYATHLAAEQHRIFNETRAGWRNEIMADEQIGGAGHQTAMAAIARARDMFVPAANKDKFNEFLRVTGAGDHPEFLRLLHNAARRFDEPSVPTTQAKPPPNIGKPPGRSGISSLYTHPSSQRTAGG